MGYGRQAGVLWLIVAALNLGLAYLAWTSGASAGGAVQTALSWFAIASAFAALVALYSGIRLLVSPSRGALFGATVWGVLNLLIIGWGFINGGDMIVLLGGLLVALATAAAFMGWQQTPTTE